MRVRIIQSDISFLLFYFIFLSKYFSASKFTFFKCNPNIILLHSEFHKSIDYNQNHHQFIFFACGYLKREEKKINWFRFHPHTRFLPKAQYWKSTWNHKAKWERFTWACEICLEFLAGWEFFTFQLHQKEMKFLSVLDEFLREAVKFRRISINRFSNSIFHFVLNRNFQESFIFRYVSIQLRLHQILIIFNFHFNKFLPNY